MWTRVVLLQDIPIRIYGVHRLQKTFIECVNVPDGINCLRGHLEEGASMITDPSPNHYLGTSLGCLLGTWSLSLCVRKNKERLSSAKTTIRGSQGYGGCAKLSSDWPPVILWPRLSRRSEYLKIEFFTAICDLAPIVPFKYAFMSTSRGSFQVILF